jgi:acyl-homoserine lactone acylase PvdQ
LLFKPAFISENQRRIFRLQWLPMKNAILLLALTLAPSPASQAADLQSDARAALAQTSGTIKLPGLMKPVTVLRDRWGVAHIYARNQHDLFFAQGFVAAQDRLFQMELWKRAGQGRLAEVLGPSAPQRDRYARLLRYRGDMKAEYSKLRPGRPGNPQGIHRRHQRLYRQHCEAAS